MVSGVFGACVFFASPCWPPSQLINRVPDVISSWNGFRHAAWCGRRVIFIGRCVFGIGIFLTSRLVRVVFSRQFLDVISSQTRLLHVSRRHGSWRLLVIRS